jgi:lysophospholipase L1-like esterase
LCFEEQQLIRGKSRDFKDLVPTMDNMITFIAIGNSLTVGFIPLRLANQPYSRFLKEITDDFLKQLEMISPFKIRILNKGVNGDLTSNMLLRFKRDVINLKPNYVIILGGTNDIGWNFPVDEIFDNLKKMFEITMDNNIKPIGCTIPSILGWDEGIPPRLKLNKMLKRFCRDKGIPCTDLFAKTCDPKTGRLRSDYSIDGLHLNASGYRKIAETIFEEAIKGLLTYQQEPKPS